MVLAKLAWSLIVLAWPLVVLVVLVYSLVVLVWPLVVLKVLVYPLLVLVFPLVVLVCSFFCPFVVIVCPLVVLVCPFVVSVCPLVVPVVLSVGFFITDQMPSNILCTFLHTVSNKFKYRRFCWKHERYFKEAYGGSHGLNFQNVMFHHFWWQKYYLFKVSTHKAIKRLSSTTIFIGNTFHPFHHENIFWKGVL